MNRWIRTAAAACLAAAAGLPAHGMPLDEQASPIDRTDWQTHCFGRFLIDLPPRTEVLDAYFMHGASINRLEDTPSTFAARIQTRQEMLEHSPHDGGKGQLFVRRVAHTEGGVSLISWKNPPHSDGQVIDTYFAAPRHGHAYYWQTEMMPGDLDAILDTADTIQKNLHARGARDIPSTPGFCLNEGFIVGGGLDTEMFQVNILLADMPGVYLLFESSTRIKTITLLDELQDFLQSKPAQAAAVEVLHQGNQAAGGIQGQEYLIVSARGSMRKYAYTWATQGRQNSAQEPSLVLELFMTEHAGAKPADDDTSSALSPDMRAALNRMNAILATLRLHPGAAAIEVPAHSPGVNPPH